MTNTKHGSRRRRRSPPPRNRGRGPRRRSPPPHNRGRGSRRRRLVGGMMAAQPQQNLMPIDKLRTFLEQNRDGTQDGISKAKFRLNYSLPVRIPPQESYARLMTRFRAVYKFLHIYMTIMKAPTCFKRLCPLCHMKFATIAVNQHDRLGNPTDVQMVVSTVCNAIQTSQQDHQQQYQRPCPHRAQPYDYATEKFPGRPSVYIGGLVLPSQNKQQIMQMPLDELYTRIREEVAVRNNIWNATESYDLWNTRLLLYHYFISVRHYNYSALAISNQRAVPSWDRNLQALTNSDENDWSDNARIEYDGSALYLPRFLYEHANGFMNHDVLYFNSYKSIEINVSGVGAGISDCAVRTLMNCELFEPASHTSWIHEAWCREYTLRGKSLGARYEDTIRILTGRDNIGFVQVNFWKLVRELDILRRAGKFVRIPVWIVGTHPSWSTGHAFVMTNRTLPGSTEGVSIVDPQLEGHGFKIPHGPYWTGMQMYDYLARITRQIWDDAIVTEDVQIEDGDCCIHIIVDKTGFDSDYETDDTNPNYQKIKLDEYGGGSRLGVFFALEWKYAHEQYKEENRLIKQGQHFVSNVNSGGPDVHERRYQRIVENLQQMSQAELRSFSTLTGGVRARAQTEWSHKLSDQSEVDHKLLIATLAGNSITYRTRQENREAYDKAQKKAINQYNKLNQLWKEVNTWSSCISTKPFTLHPRLTKRKRPDEQPSTAQYREIQGVTSQTNRGYRSPNKTRAWSVDMAQDSPEHESSPTSKAVPWRQQLARLLQRMLKKRPIH